MKIPLQYQRTEYDCGPTSVLNALSYLFHRSEIPPDMIKNVMLYCLDTYNSKGDHGKSGTSYSAMMFLSNWLNQYGRAKKYPIRTEYLFGEQVSVSPNSRIVSALQRGGVVVARVMYGCWHYVLLTGYDGEYISLWDPYYRKRPYRIPGLDIEIITDSPTEKNRRIRTEVLDETRKMTYALGAPETREAVLFFNKAVCDKPIEYYI